MTPEEALLKLAEIQHSLVARRQAARLRFDWDDLARRIASTLLLPHHVTEVRGIPTTTIARTLFDIAHRIHEDRLDRLIEMVLAKSPGVLPALHQMLEELACRGRPGIQAMRTQLKKRPKGYVACQSGLELRFERILEKAGERPLTRQVDAGGHDWLARVDFADLLLRILFEVDSILHHTTPGDRARDAARDRALKAAGWADVVRIPEEEIWYRPWLAVERVRKARSAARARTRDGITPDSGVIPSPVREAEGQS